MKKYIPLLALSMSVSLFIYVFYRTEKTLVNQVVLTLFPRQDYSRLKTGINAVLPLNDYLVYSLPEGLWVFCITLTSGFFHLELRKHKWRLEFVPIFLALMMEGYQLFHFTNGRFDWMDINFATGFWLLALFCTRMNSVAEPFVESFKIRSICCIICYSVVYLAHVNH